MNPDQNPLATKPVGKLILSYAVPSIIAMVVNALYNIVDQIFIGHGVGYLGNAATTVAFPVITIGLAIALLFGNGCAAFISLKLGENDTKDANASLGSMTTSLIIIGTLYMVFGLIFLDPLLNIMGATENIMDYSRQYVSIILIGQPFVILTTGLSNVIRADGSPKYSMSCMLIGAILNTILDPIFIFVFKWGVTGAALATLISQIVSFVVAIMYFAMKRTKNVHFERRMLKPRFDLLKTTTALGLSSFVTQISVSIVNIVLNNSLRHYGALSVYGSDIPLSAMGIVTKVGGIMVSILVGISIGAQPILGYNYGAKHFSRVKKTYQLAATSATIVAIAVWLVFIFFPEGIIRSFGDNAPEFVEFGALCFRSYQGAMFVAGFQIISSNYFQATGRPVKATFLSMTRQIIFLIPLIFIFGALFGLTGVLYSNFVADLSAVILSIFFIIPEMKRLTKLAKEQELAAA
ncbi:MATE family efflux transporter [Christensenellaceae bacterium OttesenSCG-928-K19]|nr:MATE family efflux transporter [Christensenellaceae bacterium OttesenSCG-928-K19]